MITIYPSCFADQNQLKAIEIINSLTEEQKAAVELYANARYDSGYDMGYDSGYDNATFDAKD